MILIIDNYDSFTYNLVHLVAQNIAQNDTDTAPGLEVHRNDKITVEEIRALDPTGILISPGPGRPSDAGITCDIIRDLGASIPILGVCLGHQAIGEVHGGTITYAPVLMHGKTSPITHDGRTIFEGVQKNFTATRYHSLVVSGDTLPDCLEVSARTADGIIMGVRHKTSPLEGIQFHPESLLTTEGPKLIANWVASLGVAST
ncbi:MAG: aminodeoxychorismate/anthranilate synthase component II [Rhodothermia bacterium]|nr:MAG: aminodeoxychorismate/anthranilate synthase component II [Rhodothermia bacterium]